MSTTGRDFFERKYRANDDPWSFATSEYEQQRYRTLVDHVPPGRFQRVFEPGCSIGELTLRLAERCGFVTAVDIAESAVATAHRRCRHLANVEIRRGSLPDDLPAGPFDLVVLSEIGYYFTEPQLVALAAAVAPRIDQGGELLAVHWTGVSPDHLLGGQRVHQVLREHLAMEHRHHEAHPWDERDGFVLDVWRTTPRPGPE